MFDHFTTHAIRLDHDQARRHADRFRPMVPRRRSAETPPPPARRLHSGSLFGTLEAFTPRTATTAN